MTDDVIEHVGKPRTKALLDHYECSCGWRSPTYFDGREYARSDFERHVASLTADQPGDGI